MNTTTNNALIEKVAISEAPECTEAVVEEEDPLAPLPPVVVERGTDIPVEADPEEEPLEPVEEPLKPVEEPLKPVEEPLKPVEEPVKPVEALRPVEALWPVVVGEGVVELVTVVVFEGPVVLRVWLPL